MTIDLKNIKTENEIDDAINRMKTYHKSKGLRKHFGVLKKNIDAVAVQKELRKEWN